MLNAKLAALALTLESSALATLFADQPNQQILLLFLLTFAGGMAATGSVLLAAKALTDERQRLRLDRLEKQP